jgi:hypothetical protein
VEGPVRWEDEEAVARSAPERMDRDQTRFGEAAQRRQIVKEGARIRSRPTARSS